jgi:hypothetical protein
LLTIQGYLYQSNVTLSSPRLARVGVAFITLLVMSVAVLDGIGFDFDYQRSIPLLRDIRDNPQAYNQTMAWLRRLRSGNSTNHLAMAGIYRDSLNAEADLRTRQSLYFRWRLRTRPHCNSIRTLAMCGLTSRGCWKPT